jgi:hypothetical protein
MHSSAWQQTTISSCATHHVLNGKPLYKQSFIEVLSFHDPGIAAVLDESGAYHIDQNGQAIYQQRYNRTFGFYYSRAAVQDGKRWFHILPDCSPLYKQQYKWCGNFQENACVVCDFDNQYYHIDLAGNPLYKQRYKYAGDYKYGQAVITRNDGMQTHIDSKGEFTHGQWFEQLEVFHKGFACVKDNSGWFHINKLGEAIYQERFQAVEPFYNGIAVVRTVQGEMQLINERGDIINQITTQKNNLINELSSDMVGFWKTQIIAAAVELQVLDQLPCEITTQDSTNRILNALWEMGIISKQGDLWHITEKGQLLVPSNIAPMASAAKMWCRVNLSNWKKLSSWISNDYNQYHPSIKDEENDLEILRSHYNALDGYAANEFDLLPHIVNWDKHSKLLFVGRTAKIPLEAILSKHLNSDMTILMNAKQAKTCSDVSYQTIIQDYFQIWPNEFDAIILPKFLHYFPDVQAKIILSLAVNAISPQGTIYIIEMLLDANKPDGAMLDINMYVETGGKLRTIQKYHELLGDVGLTLSDVIPLSNTLSILVIRKKND